MISGIEFAKLCSWNLCPRYPQLRPYNRFLARTGDSVFINTEYAKQCVLHLNSKHSYVFVFHNADQPVDEEIFRLFRPYTKHIFAINATFVHSRITQIPIGFPDARLPKLESLSTLNSGVRDIPIYVNFSICTNTKKRMECFDAFKGKDGVLAEFNLKTIEEYYEKLYRTEFVICPDGTGIDTHRIYEALFCGATPVVLRNELSAMYEKLPICLVNSWSDPLIHPVDKETKLQCLPWIS